MVSYFLEIASYFNLLLSYTKKMLMGFSKLNLMISLKFKNFTNTHFEFNCTNK